MSLMADRLLIIVASITVIIGLFVSDKVAEAGWLAAIMLFLTIVVAVIALFIRKKIKKEKQGGER